MSPGLDLDVVARTFGVLLARDTRPVVYVCAGSGKTILYSPDAAAARTGLLPAFLVTADAIWEQATGKSFGIEVTTDTEAVLGFRVAAIRRGTFSAVMLSLMEGFRRAYKLRRDSWGFWQKRARALLLVENRAPVS